MKKTNEYIQNGVLNMKYLKNKDISRQSLYNFVQKHHMEKIGPGIYIMPDLLEDEIYTLSLRCSQGIISHDDALYHYGLMDREPPVHCITIYSGYNPSSLTNSGYKVYIVKKELLEIGKTKVTDHFGNEVPMYDLERTICDLIRSKSNFEIQDFSTAIKTYAKRQDKDLNRLMAYTKAFKIETKIRQYLKVLL